MSMPNDEELKQLELELREPMERYTVKAAAPGDTAKLMQALQPAFNDLIASLAPNPEPIETPSRTPSVSLGRLIRSQIAAYSRAYWAASAALFIMLLFMVNRLGLAAYDSADGWFTLLMPAAMLGGMLYSFRTWNREMRMVESISPYPPALLMLTRSLIVTGLNVILGLAATLYMEWNDHRFDVLPFLTGWLSLYLLISGVTANVLLRKGLKPALIYGVILWFVWNYGQQFISADTYAAWGSNFELCAIAVGLALLIAAYRHSLGVREIK